MRGYVRDMKVYARYVFISRNISHHTPIDMNKGYDGDILGYDLLYFGNIDHISTYPIKFLIISL